MAKLGFGCGGVEGCPVHGRLGQQALRLIGPRRGGGPRLGSPRPVLVVFWPHCSKQATLWLRLCVVCVCARACVWGAVGRGAG